MANVLQQSTFGNEARGFSSQQKSANYEFAPILGGYSLSLIVFSKDVLSIELFSNRFGGYTMLPAQYDMGATIPILASFSLTPPFGEAIPSDMDQALITIVDPNGTLVINAASMTRVPDVAPTDINPSGVNNAGNYFYDYNSVINPVLGVYQVKVQGIRALTTGIIKEFLFQLS